jgi:cation transporter-like permease
MLEQAKVPSGITKLMRFSRISGRVGLVLLILSVAASLAGATLEDVTKNIRNVQLMLAGESADQFA